MARRLSVRANIIYYIGSRVIRRYAVDGQNQTSEDRARGDG